MSASRRHARLCKDGNACGWEGHARMTMSRHSIRRAGNLADDAAIRRPMAKPIPPALTTKHSFPATLAFRMPHFRNESPNIRSHFVLHYGLPFRFLPVRLLLHALMTADEYFDTHIPHRLNLLLAFRTRYSGRQSPHALNPETYRDLFGAPRTCAF